MYRAGPGHEEIRFLHGLVPDVYKVAEIGRHEVEGVPGLVLEADPGALLLGDGGDQLCVVVLSLLQTCGVMGVKMLVVKMLLNLLIKVRD